MNRIREGLVLAIGIAGVAGTVTAFAAAPAGGAPTTPHLVPAVQILGATAAERGHSPIELSPAGHFGKLLVQMTVPAGRWWISAKLVAQGEPGVPASVPTYAACKLSKLIYSAVASNARDAAPQQVLKGSIDLDQSLLEIAKSIPAAGGPGQASAPDVLSAVVTLKSKSIVGVLCTDASNHTEASDVVLSAVGR